MSTHRSGLDVMQFLMDLINHISGYTHKYYDEIQDKMDHEQLVYKYREEREKFMDKMNESDLLGDKFPHALLVIEAAHELYRMKDCERLA